MFDRPCAGWVRINIIEGEYIVSWCTDVMIDTMRAITLCQSTRDVQIVRYDAEDKGDYYFILKDTECDFIFYDYNKDEKCINSINLGYKDIYNQIVEEYNNFKYDWDHWSYADEVEELSYSFAPNAKTYKEVTEIAYNEMVNTFNK